MSSSGAWGRAALASRLRTGACSAAETQAKDYAGKLKICKLNIDDNQDTPPKYGVRGIPTLMLFKNGEVASTKIGAIPKSKLLEWVNSEI